MFEGEILAEKCKLSVIVHKLYSLRCRAVSRFKCNKTKFIRLLCFNVKSVYGKK
jgi:hypothetical protein